MKRFFSLLCLVAAGCLFTFADDSLVLHYDFETANGQVTDESGHGYTGTLYNQAEILTMGGNNVLNLGEENGYLDMGTAVGEAIIALDNFTVATYYYIDESASVSGDGYFLWAFSTSSACSQYGGEYMAYRVNKQRYALSTGGWSAEVVGIQKGSAAERGVWKHVVYTQEGTTGTIYIDGNVYVIGTASYQPKAISAATTCNWIGCSPFSGDAYLRQTMLADFRIYNKALSAAEVLALADSRMDSLESGMSLYQLEQVCATLSLEDTIDITDDITLQSNLSGISITWESSSPDIISADGEVSRPAYGSDTAVVILTATLSNGSVSTQKLFQVTVLPYFDDATSVQRDLAALIFNTDKNILKYNLSLPATGSEGSTYTWTSSDTAYLANDGALLQIPAAGGEEFSLTLQVEVAKGNEKKSVTYPISIPAEPAYYAYLFAYFTGNSISQEAIHFALSFDGFNYKALNSDKPIIASDTISEMGGVRDPHIMRCMDDHTFYMVVTDMKSSNGWNSNHGMVLLKSEDLINWAHTAVDVADVFSAFSEINRCWAPQTIYDQNAGKYMLYWSMRAGSDIDVIYYAYANDGFTGISTEPQVLFDNPAATACIDGDIIYKDGTYYMFYKTEGSGNGIKKVQSATANGPFEVKSDSYLQSTTDAVEGSCVFKLYDSDTYILMYDLYTSGKYQFTQTSNLEKFSIVSNTSMNFTPRHGTVIPITKDETRRLIEQWGDGFDPIPDDIVKPVRRSKRKDISLWPSPVEESLHIGYDVVGPLYIDVYGLSGNCLLETQLYTDAGIDCSSLLPGCYMLQVSDGTMLLHSMFIKR